MRESILYSSISINYTVYVFTVCLLVLLSYQKMEETSLFQFVNHKIPFIYYTFVNLQRPGAIRADAGNGLRDQRRRAARGAVPGVRRALL